MEYPARGYHVPHPHDVSLQTYRGHCVSQTLIRAYFSPAATTAQRYVYAGSADGAVRIWGAPGRDCHGLSACACWKCFSSAAAMQPSRDRAGEALQAI